MDILHLTKISEVKVSQKCHIKFNKQKKKNRHNEHPQELDYRLIICYYNTHKTRLPAWKGGGGHISL